MCTLSELDPSYSELAYKNELISISSSSSVLAYCTLEKVDSFIASFFMLYSFAANRVATLDNFSSNSPFFLIKPIYTVERFKT